MRTAADLPNVTSVTIVQKRSKRSAGDLTASCYIHGPDIPENTGFSDYALPFREVNQCTTSFGPVRINSQSTAHFSTAPICCYVTSALRRTDRKADHSYALPAELERFNDYGQAIDPVSSRFYP